MSSMLFNIAIDWVLCRTMEDQQRGIRWTPFTILEDLDFANDLALLSHPQQHIQEKTKPAQHVQQPGWLENQLKEDGGHVSLTQQRSG